VEGGGGECNASLVPHLSLKSVIYDLGCTLQSLRYFKNQPG
jgi:hypothetical protein